MKNSIIIIALLVMNLILSGFIIVNTNSNFSVLKEKTAVMETLLYDLDEDIHELEEKH
tara:strand:+ start:370 stop:543 length:174 start_codon:yes stop_codon:yes gene_type:complete